MGFFGGAPARTDLIPSVVQQTNNGASTASLAVTIAAAQPGQRLIVVTGSTGRDTNPPTCDNVTFTLLKAASVATQYVRAYLGIVGAVASGTTITVTAASSNWMQTDVYEIDDQLAGTVGQSSSKGATAGTINNQTWTPITPDAGDYVVLMASESNGTYPLLWSVPAPYYARAATGGTAYSAVMYAPGGPLGPCMVAGGTNVNVIAAIVAFT